MQNIKTFFLAFIILVSFSLLIPFASGLSRPNLYVSPSYPSLSLKLTYTETLTIGVQNNLSSSDTIHIELKGGASSLLNWDIEEISGMSCPSKSECDLSLNPGETKEFDIDFEGVRVGDSSLIVEGTSKSTGLKDKRSIDVSVITSGRGVFSAPGMTWAGFASILVLSSIIFLALWRR